MKNGENPTRTRCSHVLTDVDEKRGIGSAQRMGGHSTQTQTAEYVRHKVARKTGRPVRDFRFG
jgi:hypothetical protein